MRKTNTAPGSTQTAEAGPVNRHDRRRQRTREAILNAADRVFRLKGIDAATVNDITEEADVAYGSFYNHFKTMDELVAALAEVTLKGVADRTGEIFGQTDRIELLPCIGARIVMRVLTQDPAVRWLLQRPYIFVEEFYKMARPFMVGAERDAILSGTLRPVGGHETWLRTYPWILLAELTEAIRTGDIRKHEDQFALISLRFLGVDDALAADLIEQSLEMVRAAGLPET